MGIDNEEKYSFVITKGRAYFFLKKINKLEKDITLNNDMTHEIFIQAGSSALNMSIDGANVFTIDSLSNYTKGFFSIEETETFADITNVVIRKGHKSISNFILAYPNAYYQKEDIISTLQDKSAYLSANGPNGSTSGYPTAEYVAKESGNITEYSMELYFRVRSRPDFSLYSHALDISYDEAAKSLIISNTTKVALPVKNESEWHSLQFTVNPPVADIYFDKKHVATVPVKDKKRNITITSYSNVDISSFSLKDNLKPYAIEYVFPRVYTTNYAGLNTPSTSFLEQIKNVSAEEETQKQFVKNYLENEAIGWENYTISVQYFNPQDGKLAISVSAISNDLYGIFLENGTAHIRYNGNQGLKKVVREVDMRGEHTLLIEVRNSTLTILSDTLVLLNSTVDDASNGAVFLDYPDMVIESFQIQNTDTKEVKKREDNRAICTPRMIRQYYENGTLTLNPEEKKIITLTRSFEEEFDVAKVQVSLDSDHLLSFWISKI
jgi:hypothetical protein